MATSVQPYHFHHIDIETGFDNPDNYLHRTVEVMPSSLNILIQSAMDSSNERPYVSYEARSVLWYIAGWTAIVATTALAVSSMVAVGVFYPVYIPFVPLATFVVLQSFLIDTIKGCFTYAREDGSIAEHKSKVRTIIQDQMTNEAPEQIEARIRNELDYYGIDHSEIDSELSRLVREHDFKPVLAELYLCKQGIDNASRDDSDMRQVDQRITEQLHELSTTGETNIPELRERLLERERLRLDFLRDKVAVAKYISVLAQPRQNSLFNEIFIGSTNGDGSVNRNNINPVGNLAREALHRMRSDYNSLLMRIFNANVETLVFPDLRNNLSMSEINSLSFAHLARHITFATTPEA